MATTEGLDLTAKFEVSADGIIRQNAETVNDRKRISRPGNNIVRI
jgi:hypothetical protein